jgi:hypothetical protein
MKMIRVSQYWQIALITGIAVLVVLKRYRFENLLVRDLANMILIAVCAAWMLKYGFEGIIDARRVKGRLSNRQRADYYISVGQFIGGIIAALFVVFFLLFQSYWRVFSWAESWGLGVTPR